MKEVFKCKECGFTASREEWGDYYFACEDCGGHSGVQCPKCEWTYDLVFDDIEVEEASTV